VSSAAPRDATAFEVREALALPGCAVCRLSLRSVSRLIGSMAYEQVNDVGLRQELRQAGGFCNTHAHQWLEQARSVLGTALIYRDVLNASLSQLEPGSMSPPRRRLRGVFGNRPDARCPGCTAQAEAEERYLAALLAVVTAEPWLLEGSEALCRRHTLAAGRLGGAQAEPIVRRTREVLEQMLADLDEVIRKEDYRFREEPRSESERTVPTRAVTWAAGASGLVDI
jgi:uncharacterized protein DUF6062